MKDGNKKIVIIGLGLIGGSLAKALKSKGYKIIGIDKNKAILKKAIKGRVITKSSLKLSSELLNNVHMIFIATPLNLISDYLTKIAKLKLTKEIIIADVGSTKTDICKKAQKIFSAPIFIGGHPMAGTEHSGYRHSKKDLFKNNQWVLTPTSNDKKTKSSMEFLKKAIKDTGAKILITNPEDHDRAAALISHLPLLSAIGLYETLKNTKDKKIKSLAIKMASSGFKDTTRLARGNFKMNKNILISNKKEIKKILPVYVNQLNKIIKIP